MQCIFPVIIFWVATIVCLVIIIPSLNNILQAEEIQSELNAIKFNSEIVCIILGALQVLYTMTNISLTAISRDGKDALFIKYIPVELYKQFVYKALPQIFINIIISIVLLGIICWLLPFVNITHALILFVISIAINAINSYLMLLIDLRRPNLNWDSEYTVVKKSDNKIFQYVLMIIMVLILMYISTIFKNININKMLILELLFFGIIFILIDRLIKKFQNKIFNKIF
jgi:ABC-2 type transport system permease protein